MIVCVLILFFVALDYYYDVIQKLQNIIRIQTSIINIQANSLDIVKNKEVAIIPAFINDGTFSQTCAICIEEVLPNSVLVSLECGHQFHVVCIFEDIRTSNKNRCPLCRKALTSVIIG
jgi:hypothetical protein